MWRTKTFDCSEIGIPEPFQCCDLKKVQLSRLSIKGDILSPTGVKRGSLHSTPRQGMGGNGVLEERVRVTETAQQIVLLKRPRDTEDSLRVEAFIQWLVYKTFEANGLKGRVPAICDILELPDKTEAFIMEEMTKVTLCSTFLAESHMLRTDIFHILIQVAVLLQTLETLIGFDHRDLKADNLLIREEESRIYCYCPDIRKRMLFQSPFTVCIIDFGFACLGNLEKPSITALNADEKDTLPQLDPCPKDGRDIYHLIASLYSIERIRHRIENEPELHTMFKDWLNVQETATSEFVTRWATSDWIYLITGHKNFTHNKCTPSGILTTLYSIEPELFTITPSAAHSPRNSLVL